MNAIAFVLELLSKLPAVLNATRRLVQATKDTEPPPVMSENDALNYLRGANNEKHKAFMHNVMGKVEKEKPEEPTDG